MTATTTTTTATSTQTYPEHNLLSVRGRGESASDNKRMGDSSLAIVSRQGEPLRFNEGLGQTQFRPASDRASGVVSLLTGGSKNHHAETHAQPPAQSSTTIRVLILIASIPRTPETVCITIKSILDHFLSDATLITPSTNNGNRSTVVVVEPPVILVHRYGPWTCNNSFGSSIGEDIILRKFPPHERVSNTQQTNDYLDLMNDALQLLQQPLQNNNDQQQHPRQPPYLSHVMFLDDDVELCPHFSDIISLIHNVAPQFTLAHLGRGGSGVLVSSFNLARLRDSVLADHSGGKYSALKEDDFQKRERRRRLRPPNKKQRMMMNIDKSFLEWALQAQQGCTIRPTTIQMRHIGLQSRLRPGKTWKDVDQCGQASNNRAWQSLSENHLHTALFSEYCVYPAKCSPYSSIRGENIMQGMDRSDDSSGCRCLPGFTGSDCGIPIQEAAVPSRQYVRRNLNAPIVVLLSAKEADQAVTLGEDFEHQVLADARAHHLVNLYVIGDSSRTQWLADNVYASSLEAHHVLEVGFKNSSRFGELAFPIELITLERLLSPQELWTLKYYEAQDE